MGFNSGFKGLITFREFHMGFKFGDGSVTVADETKHTFTPGHIHDNTLCRPSVWGYDLRYVLISSAPVMVGQYKLPDSQPGFQFTSSSYTVSWTTHSDQRNKFYWRRLWYMYVYVWKMKYYIEPRRRRMPYIP